MCGWGRKYRHFSVVVKILVNESPASIKICADTKYWHYDCLVMRVKAEEKNWTKSGNVVIHWLFFTWSVL